MQGQQISSQQMLNTQIQNQPMNNIPNQQMQNINNIATNQVMNQIPNQQSKPIQQMNQSDPMSALQNLASSQTGTDVNQQMIDPSNNQMPMMNQVINNQIITPNQHINQIPNHIQPVQPMLQQRVPLTQNRMIVGNTNVPRPGQIVGQNFHRLKQPNSNIQMQPLQQNNNEYFQNTQNNNQPMQQSMNQQQFQSVPNQQFQNNVQNQNINSVNQIHNQIPMSNSVQMAPSPSTYVPSPSNVMSSPMNVNMIGQRGPPSVSSIASPNPTLNTPVMNANSSPNMRQNTNEDQLYREKLRQLSKYIEPLKKMVIKYENSENANSMKEATKIKNLFEIISDPNKRCRIDVLLKCEEVLERMDLFNKTNINHPQLPNQVAISNKIESNVCQSLIETIQFNYKNPNFNHTLQRTFGPAVAAIKNNCSENYVSRKENEISPKKNIISHTIQGEIAKLDFKFLVELYPLQHPKNKTLHLVCKIDDVGLPCVPPILINVPCEYPTKPPRCIINKEDYQSSKYLNDVYNAFTENLEKSPDLYSITTLLDKWEMSIRQALNLKSIFSF